ncbi:uncharacterized protein LOC119666681 isoform X2 [Teleopsis dalmanni]|nr:uncharacterized protein LOC119666681 isoform X2 [Teleopsis dalmanni]XP_037931891.1 uncharacterized protein LOC119666681 isoform X2 [Teleopsis dalmanni]
MSPADDSSYAANGSRASKKATYTLLVIKVLELLLLICCIGLIDSPAAHSQARTFITPRVAALCYVTFGSLIIYTSINLIMTMFGDATPWRSATLWSLVAFVLFIATTALLFRDWSNTKMLYNWHPNMQRLDFLLGAASVSLVTTIIYLIDVILTIRFGMSGELE